MHIKRDDTVIVLSGKDKGKKGKVLSVIKESGKADRVIVEGVNVATKAVKPTRQDQQGGLIESEIPIYASKVMRVCPKCGKPTREAWKVEANGDKSRVCKQCGETI